MGYLKKDWYMRESLNVIAASILLLLFVASVSFSLTTAIYWFFTWAFGFDFYWKHAFGIWVALLLLNISRSGKK